VQKNLIGEASQTTVRNVGERHLHRAGPRTLALLVISILAPLSALAQTDEGTGDKYVDCALQFTRGQIHQHNAVAQLAHAKSKQQMSVAIQEAHAATREVLDGIEDCHPDFVTKIDTILHLTYKSFTCINSAKFLAMSFDATRKSDLTLTYFAEKAYADALDDCDLINDQR
jgi:hypothetical protein